MVIKYWKKDKEENKQEDGDKKSTKKDGGSGGKQRHMQLTLNIPTYTKCAKIYQNLMLVVKKVDADRQSQHVGDRKDGKNAVGKASEKDKLNLSYVDQLVQYELRLVLKQITGGPTLTADKDGDKNKDGIQSA